MAREQHIPLVLWLSTAILAHISSVGVADQVARNIQDRADIRAYASAIRDKIRPPATLEVALEPQTDELAPPPDVTKPAPRPEATAAQIKPKESPPPKIETPKPEPPKPDPKQAEPEKKVIVLPQMATAAPPPPPPPPEPKADRRVAVRQHVEPNQEDNPNAHFIGDEANHVAEESASRITSHDQDDPNPTPGGAHSGADQEPGNSDQTKVADSEDRPGEQKRAPGENSPSADPTPAGRAANASGPKPGPVGAPAPRPASAQNPDPVAQATQGEGYSLDPLRHDPPAPESTARPDQKARPPSPLEALGLGGKALANGINLNLTQQGVVAVVGQDQLTRERLADGERRKSQHRGSWRTSSFERWRASIENYVSSVKTGNQTALNTARVPFATYLNTMHNRIHPIFADDFLMTLDGLPGSHPMSDMKMYASLEIVLDRDQGRLVKMGVVRTSGVTAFDIAALDSVQRASPFGKPPSAIVSGDGNVYLHWEFHRDPLYACSTAGARPYMLPTPPGSKEPAPPKSSPPLFPPGDPRERGDSRQGSWHPRRKHTVRVTPPG